MDDSFDCPVCGERVVERLMLGGPMICDVTFIVVGDLQNEWGTSGPHNCEKE